MEIKKEQLFLGLIIFITLALGFFFLIRTTSLETIPTCTFGCVEWYSQAMFKDLLNNPEHLWQSQGLSYDGVPSNFPKTHAYLQLVTYHLTKGVFHFDYFTSWKAIIIYSFFMYILLNILIYFGMYKLTKNHFIAIISSLLLNPLNYYPAFTYSAILPNILFAALLLLYNYCKEKRKIGLKTAIQILMFVLVFILIFHHHQTMPFVVAGWLLSFLIVENWEHLLKFGKNYKKILLDNKNIIIVLIIFIAGITSLLMPWWHSVVFDFKTNYAQEYKINDSLDFQNPKIYLSELWHIPQRLLFNYSTTFNALISILCCLGIFYLLFAKIKENSPNKNLKNLTAIFLLAYIILSYNYILTNPLLGTDFSPDRLGGYILTSARIIAAIFAVIISFDILKPKLGKHAAGITSTIYALIICAIIVYTLLGASSKYNSQYYIESRNVSNNIFANMYYSLYSDYFEKNNLDPSKAIVLSTNELSNTLNGFVGVSTISGRYANFYHYVDYQEYWMDATLILYSNNSQTRKLLIDEYKNKEDYDFYLYWDYYWPNSEVVFNEAGAVVYYYNPFKFIDEKYVYVLNENNISYIQDYQSFEPNTYGSDLYRKFNLSVVTSNNYRTLEQPWDPDLNKYLTEVWSYNYQGYKLAVLYKIE
ncbi:MAG: hypothetical protein ACP5N3_03365 [Candidatus Nanoarchaeia archaeon]